MANTLFLRLEGPLQSWGERAQWSVRDSATEPTKSGIVGILGCAQGINDDDGLRSLSRSVRVGVRCDYPGIPLVDYHTVGGGYGEPTLLTAEGKPKYSSGRPHNEQTWRTYLSDASFLVAVQADADTVQRLAAAVQHPVWPFYLGRKSCPPTRPIYDGIGDHLSLEEALSSRPMVLRKGNETVGRVRTVMECPASAPDAVRRRDEIASHSRRTFFPRYSSDVLLAVATQKEAE